MYELKNVEVERHESGSTKIRLTQLGGGEVDIWFYNNDFDKICEAIEETEAKTEAKVDISGKTELQKDMHELARLTYELSKKHGGIFVTTTAYPGYELAWATYKPGEKILSEEYWPEENKKSCKSS